MLRCMFTSQRVIVLAALCFTICRFNLLQRPIKCSRPVLATGNRSIRPRDFRILSPTAIVASQFWIEAYQRLSQIVGRLRIAGMNPTCQCFILVHLHARVSPRLLQSMFQGIPFEASVLPHVRPSPLHDGATVIGAVNDKSVISHLSNNFIISDLRYLLRHPILVYGISLCIT